MRAAPKVASLTLAVVSTVSRSCKFIEPAVVGKLFSATSVLATVPGLSAVDTDASVSV